jgi:hypothetical protein
MEIIDYLAGLYHAINDVFTFLGWVFSNLLQFLHNLFLPVNYIFQFIKGFTDTAFQPAIPPVNVWTFPAGITAIFNAIPYWATISHVIALAFFVIVAVSILKNFLHI